MLQEQPFSTLETSLSYVTCYMFLTQKRSSSIHDLETRLL